ncbi:CDP-alcohol phosphatidyltransferase family protein [Streptomyces zingiberis]|uniref:CDP-alcohol phosphatidyltransferase family protein n=1 Tax=Streptomyces zingiberis TaxID=2053010 RepID=A0ABX1BT50_9ACTN|nr:CDP-alcohol phosphatidyltransferase family protein [Streptomyces zingiberis]NJP99590.1 CDP-alcohol phosphatidyltransferase family protein [Streptomyces zingiberis]
MALSDTFPPRLLRQETSVGAGAQLLLLAVLGAAVGLGPAGWPAGLAFTAVTWFLLSRALLRSWPPRPFGAANAVTLARTTLVGGVTALVADSFTGPAPVAVLTALTAVALILDAVDGQVARRTGTESPLGARFDMEVDAFLILVLSAYLAQSLGAWVLLIGAMRYAFVAAGRALPWLNGPLPPSMARKTVAALQGVVLLVAASGTLPSTAAYAVVGTALALLVWSFARDVRSLWRLRSTADDRARGHDRDRDGGPAPAPAPAPERERERERGRAREHGQARPHQPARRPEPSGGPAHRERGRGRAGAVAG